MSWRASLRPAALGGVRFHTSDRQHHTGRRLVIHEYPKRDQPFPEDMGRATRKWQVDAYVIGDDYMSRRDALIAKGEAAGPQSYTDHWGRSARVVVEKCELVETSRDGRYARIQLSLVEAGGGLPIGGLAVGGIALVAASAGLAGAAAGAFQLGIAGIPGAVAQAGALGALAGSAGRLLSVAQAPLAALSGVIGHAGGALGQMSALLSRGAAVTGAVGNLTQAVGTFAGSVVPAAGNLLGQAVPTVSAALRQAQSSATRIMGLFG